MGEGKGEEEKESQNKPKVSLSSFLGEGRMEEWEEMTRECVGTEDERR